MWRYIFLLFCSVVAFTTCGIITNCIQLILYLTVKQVRSDLYYKINFYLVYTLKSLVLFFGDWYSDSELYVYMDRNDFKKYFGKENMFLITNHTGEVDWLFFGLLCDNANLLGNARSFMKNDFKYLPGIGTNLLLSDYIFLSRNYEKDKKIIEDKVKILINYPSNTCIGIAPEGTRFTQEKHELSMQFAKKNGLPILKYHLTPRTKGFTTSLPIIQEKLKSVYDVTLAFKPNETEPKLMNILLGKKIKAYCYIKRIPIEDTPKDKEGASKFLHNLFVEKDKLVDSFYKTGDFITYSEGKTVEKIKIRKNILCLLNAIAWYTFSVGMVLYFFIRLLLAGYTSVLLIGGAVYIIILMLVYKVVSMSLMRTASVYGLNKNCAN